MTRQPTRRQPIAVAPTSSPAQAVIRLAAGALSSVIGRRSRGVSGVCEEDVIAETRLRLLALAERFDPAKGSPEGFARGVARKVRQEMARAVRRSARIPTECRDTTRDALDPVEVAMAAETRDRVRAAIEKLSREDADVVKWRFGIGPGLDRVATLSPREQCRLCRALKKLRPLLIEGL